MMYKPNVIKRVLAVQADPKSYISTPIEMRLPSSNL